MTDILVHKRKTFSVEADSLIAEIVRLGGQKELERTFNLFVPPPLPEFEKSLKDIRQRLVGEAKHRGWEV